MTDTIRSTNGYQKTGDINYFTIYSETTEIEQQFASKTVKYTILMMLYHLLTKLL